MLTLVFFATPGSVGASTATLGAHLALNLAETDAAIRHYSDRPHPHAQRAELVVEPRSNYGKADCDLAIFDASDTVRPRTTDEGLQLADGFDQRSVVWLPIVAPAPQARKFLESFTPRPVVPLLFDLVPRGRMQQHLPMLDDLARQVLEEGPQLLGYLPRLSLQRWTQAWIDLLLPIVTTSRQIGAVK